MQLSITPYFNLFIILLQGLLVMHCCAMQGRIDVSHLLLTMDDDHVLRQEIEKETGNNPPSVVHLAVANDYLECGFWYFETLKNNG